MTVLNPEVREEARQLIRLAMPIAAVNVGNILLGLVDSAIVGRLSERALGAVGMGAGVHFVISTLGLGLMLGLDPLITQSIGAGEPNKARRYLWQGYFIAAIVTIPLAVVTVGATLSLESAGVEPETVAETAGYVFGRLPSLIPFLMLSGARSYLQAHSVVRPLVIGVIVANLLNLPISWFLVFGGFGIDGMGATGAGVASTIAMALQFGIAALGIRALGPRKTKKETPVDRSPDWATIRHTMRIGAPIAGMLFAEVGIFVLVALLAGIMGDRELAAHQVAITLASASFVVTMGIGMSATVRVGHAIGRNDTVAARRSGLVAIGLGGVYMVGSALLFVILPGPLARIITPDPDVIAASVPLLMIAAIFQLSDGAQAVTAGALRGLGDTRFPFVTNVLGHYMVGLPIALWMGFHLGYGAPGLWWGLVGGLTVVAIGLVWRFVRITSGTIDRV